MVLVLLNVVAAAMQGFFSEAFAMAGLVVGYICGGMAVSRRRWRGWNRF